MVFERPLRVAHEVEDGKGRPNQALLSIAEDAKELLLRESSKTHHRNM